MSGSNGWCTVFWVKRHRFLDLAVLLCYVLDQNTLLLQCASQPRNLKGYQWIVREVWWNARGLAFMKDLSKIFLNLDAHCAWMDFSYSIWNCIQKYYSVPIFKGSLKKINIWLQMIDTTYIYLIIYS